MSRIPSLSSSVSQASPSPSPSVSFWSGLYTPGQLSYMSLIPSKSESSTSSWVVWGKDKYLKLRPIVLVFSHVTPPSVV